MKEKKQSKDWYVAVTHYLTAGFAIPWVIVLVFGIPLTILIGTSHIMFLTIAMSIVWLLSIWLGVMYAAKYINKTYVIKNRDHVAKLAATYLVIIGGVYRFFIFFFKGVALPLIVELIFFATGVALFYFLSKKYIQNDI